MIPAAAIRPNAKRIAIASIAPRAKPKKINAARTAPERVPPRAAAVLWLHAFPGARPDITCDVMPSKTAKYALSS